MASAGLGRTPLPPNPYPEKDLRRQAYNASLLLEASSDNLDLLHGRILGYLLLHVPDITGKEHIVTDILRCEGDLGRLRQLSRFYRLHLLQACHERRERVVVERRERTVVPDRSPNNVYQQALRRDGFRCLATGSYEQSHLTSLYLANKLPPGHLSSAPLHATPIFPHSINSLTTMRNIFQGDESLWAVTILTLITGTTKGSCSLLKDGAELDSLGNVLTLSTIAQNAFDLLSLWFEADPEAGEHCYRTHTSHEWYCKPRFDRVQFSNHDLTSDSELPDGRLLSLHAAICKVAHLSGLESHLFRMGKAHEQSDVLAQDGTSAEWLEAKLSAVAILSGKE